MDYLTVNQVAFLSAFIASLALLIVLLYQSIKDSWKRLLLIGFSGQLVWSLALLSNYSFNLFDTTELLFIENLRFSLWHITLFLLLSKVTSFRTWPSNTKIITFLAIIINIASFIAVFSQNLTSVSVISGAFTCLALIGVIFTEQVVKNLNTHRMVKILALCLTTLFVFDTLVYGYSTLYSYIPTFMWQSRAALLLAISLLLSVGFLVFNQRPSTSVLFAVSRPAAFYSSTFLIIILVIAAFGFGSHYLDTPGFLASYLFTLALLAGLLLTVALVISSQFRQKVDVFFSKHFFSLQYDYRQEWLSVTRRISDLGELQTQQFYEETLSILCNAIKATSGSLWLHESSVLVEKVATLELKNKPTSVDSNSTFIKTILKENWIFAPNSDLESLKKKNDQLPSWIIENSDIWMLAPLIVQMKLIGFVIIKRPSSVSDLTYEDRDLMTNVSTQIANQIRLRQQESTITQAKQLETYNQMSAFIMHDTNNVIAQLALLVNNAQRHKNNPAFIDDMVRTVDNAVNRMKGLVQKFNPNSDSRPEYVQASEIIKHVVEATADRMPTVEVEQKSDFKIYIDKSKLILAIKNIVRNAQEASNKDDMVTISINQRSISITDMGNGMDDSFIRNELFHPFSTTKSENGIGIGAYLTKSFLEEAGASLRVSSEQGIGSNFTITFPGDQ